MNTSEPIYLKRMEVNKERKEKLLKYFKDNFSAMDNPFTSDLVESIIDYSIVHENISKHQMAYFLSDIIPEVEFEVLDKIIGY